MGISGRRWSVEYLAGEGLAVDHETLRRRLIAEGTRKVRVTGAAGIGLGANAKPVLGRRAQLEWVGSLLV